ncbi:MAG TPA: ABC transporter ATP-binding protein [Steroidobacteraceae bacterium]|nr:ABC transporter ATP-binding protein [Steroidobacteraceae bacterium]
MSEAVVQTRSLRRQFGATVAVADLSLSIGRGEIFGFLGPNGAGKTTSLKLLLGLLEPGGGTGEVLGAPLGERRARARIGFLPEHFRFHSCLTGRELLRFHGKLHGMRGAVLERRIDELLVRVDLTDAEGRPLREYSKGMTQRVGLAQALINDPELVFLDEPTSGLDPLGRLLVRDIIQELRDRGTTVFLNSHLLGEVEATCDRVVFVREGRVVRELSLAQSVGDIAVELRVAPLDPATLAGLAQFGSAITRTRELLRMRVSDESVLPKLAAWLVGRGLSLYELRSRRRSLEEWFVEIMGDGQRPG